MDDHRSSLGQGWTTGWPVLMLVSSDKVEEDDPHYLTSSCHMSYTIYVSNYGLMVDEF